MTTVNVHTQVADVLAAARGLIEEWGWGPDAAVGALSTAGRRTGGERLYLLAREALLDVVGGHWLHDWIDAPRRTKAEVLAAFETAEANERRRADSDG